ncbi:MAG: hypothetical protein ACOX0R_02815 [Candidatus Dojkabacteria bacterium]|jgi:hypothetical protein
MRLTYEDITIILDIIKRSMSEYDKRFTNVEKLIKKLTKKRKIDDSWMSYDELSKNIVELSGDEYYRDFNISRMNGF